jgi:hypothetical protein
LTDDLFRLCFVLMQHDVLDPSLACASCSRQIITHKEEYSSSSQIWISRCIFGLWGKDYLATNDGTYQLPLMFGMIVLSYVATNFTSHFCRPLATSLLLQLIQHCEMNR